MYPKATINPFGLRDSFVGRLFMNICLCFREAIPESFAVPDNSSTVVYNIFLGSSERSKFHVDNRHVSRKHEMTVSPSTK